MSNSRTKRQFAGAASDPAQRSITSFFKTTQTSDDSQFDSTSGASPATAAAPLNGPVLSPTIRSSLLNVGMRVRKSVPEGYKTGKIASGFPSWMDDSNNTNNRNHISGSGASALAGNNGHNRPVSAAPSAPPAAASANRELTPFCGIHKIGGYAVQDSNNNNNSAALSSQDSNASSTISNPSSIRFAMTQVQDAANRKRIHEDGSSEEGGAGLFGEDMDWRRREEFYDDQDEERAPRSLEPMAWCGGGNKTNTIANDRRVMAVPKRRGSQFTQTTINFGGYVPQSSGVAPVDDFEEAPFLDYGLSHYGGRSGHMDMD
ncbi:hypothetical protein GE21DRAFT_2110 [Neurospora crassa]|uniref:Uncharacterized protein n=1 Tax=Neurospora crassa (strain ATCC 24698 / 74-OR23-1A / CBS 708.71 / DSM 1257 / FGSC 987) TaxID=367110 RepID=Q7SI33_NEUCR|nr:hypothetical protein NCU00619 [Neurospora crassa OR74A]EAA36523.1 hypothetical protein NCU00619 [Neurospora crassa OR74A]KHE89848.1 hypothetical protein GE21DRAFT_2110 [Neurospora crassa]|eukprot:XP_965759.1 hypothetical protein NCU00619 [Neurospora crassa OR74A]